MSGGFFRGTSADQDTRFSNKEAKLLKSQKFASELEHLVDMTKVKLDVIRPWIANRVTELLGFEDEVLINFIYGLLDGKDVDGKQVQIQLTGFMEKNTGKFMKELWTLLLSAQKNVSGVPQQFLDAKEEETRKKKVEADRITHEIQIKKEREGREVELSKQKKMDGEGDISRSVDGVSNAIGRHSVPRSSSFGPEERIDVDGRHDSKGMSRKSVSPHTGHRSPSPHRMPSASGSSSKSFSRSRSYSDEQRKSRSISRSPQHRRRSISLEHRYRSPRRRSISPRRRHSPWGLRSPPRRRSPYPRRRSTSRSRRRSPSPIHRRSPPPARRRSPSPLRRRSISPVRRRSPFAVRRRSPPPRRRSPSPRWRSPSPRRRWSPSPMRRRSPPPRSPRYRRRSPVKSPRRRPMDSPISSGERRRSQSPYRSRSPTRSRQILSGEREGRANGMECKKYADDYAPQRARSKRSPDRYTPEAEVDRYGFGRKMTESRLRQPPISLRSPQRDPKDRDTHHRPPVSLRSPQRDQDSRHKMMALSPASDKFPSPSKNVPRRRRSSPVEDGPESPPRRTREQATRHDSPETSMEEEELARDREDIGLKANSLQKKNRHSPTNGSGKKPIPKGNNEDDSDKVVCRSSDSHGHLDYAEMDKKLRVHKSDRSSVKTEMTSQESEEVEYGPGSLDYFPVDHVCDDQPSADHPSHDSSLPDERLSHKQRKTYSRVEHEVKVKKRSISSDDEYGSADCRTEALSKSLERATRNDQMDHDHSDSDREAYRKDVEKRKYKRSDSCERALDNEAGYDSQVDERREAKRRKKEEKKLRKEERRRRREERHRRREERRAGKLKSKSIDTVNPPSDFENNDNDAGDSDGDTAGKKDRHPSDSEEMESEQKKLEIELRKKALESLRAKKAISH